MKELSIKEKAKRYDEALAMAKEIYNGNPSSGTAKVVCKHIFPELENIENEEIKNEIINYFKCQNEEEPTRKNILNKWIKWLEKQGEHANFLSKIQVGDKVTRNDNGELVNLSQLERVAKPSIPEIVDEHFYEMLDDKVEPKFKVGDRVIGIISDIPYFITEVCDDYYNTESGCIIMFCAQDNFKIYEQKPAWSEEDEKMLNSFLHKLEVCDLLSNKEVIWIKDKLKFIRPQFTWKPSDEQIRPLEYAIDYFRRKKNDTTYLESLYQDLMKLREE